MTSSSPSRRSIITISAKAESASIRAVLPTLTGRTYANLAIQEGDAASREFMRVHFGDASEPERQRVRRQLEDYCGQDTAGMVWIVEALQRLTG